MSPKMPSAKAKQELRSFLHSLKQRWTPSIISRRSRAIERHLADWSVYRQAAKILFYMPLRKEPQIQGLMRRALAQKKCLSVPSCDISRGTMQAYGVQSLEELVPGPYGIHQPKLRADRLIKKGDLDLIFVPGVAFDAAGNRLGRGKGFYDRFLKRTAGEAVKVGVAFHAQLVERVPVSRWDVAVDYVVTEEGIEPVRRPVKKISKSAGRKI